MSEKVSVIVPIYKVEKYLEACVDSIIGQTYENLEIILVDDGSPDGCGDICDRYLDRDPRIRVVHKENGGLSDARNAGMDIATGDYYFFVDSDDSITPDAVELLLDIARKENADLVIGSHDRFEDEIPMPMENDPKKYQVWTIHQAMANMFRNGCAAWARLYRRELHHDIHFPVGQINEDEAIVLQILDRCNKVVKAEAIIYHYRCRPESITTATFSPKKLDWYHHCISNLAWVQKNRPDLAPLAIDRLGSSIVFLLHQMAICSHRDDELSALLLTDLKKGYRTYQKYYLSPKKEKIRMWFLNYFPYPVYYGIYQAIMKMKRSIGRDGNV